MTEFGAVLYDIGSASDGRPGYAVTLEQHVEIASGARGAQGAGGERRRWRPWLKLLVILIWAELLAIFIWAEITSDFYMG